MSILRYNYVIMSTMYDYIKISVGQKFNITNIFLISHFGDANDESTLRRAQNAFCFMLFPIFFKPVQVRAQNKS